MALTRRETSKLLIGGAAAMASASPASAFLHKKPDWPVRLQQDLDGHLLPFCDGKLTVTGWGMKPGQRVVMASIIRLDWPPGRRTRKFQATGDEAEATYNALLNQALFEFGRAWPGCVA